MDQVHWVGDAALLFALHQAMEPTCSSPIRVIRLGASHKGRQVVAASLQNTGGGGGICNYQLPRKLTWWHCKKVLSVALP
jgi:cell division FtsZ-interacting protein ZapD